DEASIGYNAALIAKTLHDQNHRFLPVYTLTLNGSDWKQPVNIYANAVIFRLFGPSTFKFKLTSLLFIFLSAFFIFLTLKKLKFSFYTSLAGTIFYLLNPGVYINSRLGLENVSLLPFIALWLYLLVSYFKNQKPRYLSLAGLVLGLSFYSYKGMQLFVWPLAIASIIYILYLDRKINFKTVLKFIIPFSLPLSFIPLWQIKYAGAVLNASQSSSVDFFQAVYKYLSVYNPAVLFVSSDKLLIHSTQIHGMMLLVFLPLLIIGLGKIKPQAIKILIISSLILLPLPITLTNSIGRTSRLLVLIPFFSLIITYGFAYLVRLRKTIFIPALVIVLALINFGHFFIFYQTAYPQLLRSKLPTDNLKSAMANLSRSAKANNLNPVIDKDLFLNYKPQVNFYTQIYFADKQPAIIDLNKAKPGLNDIILTNRKGDRSLAVQEAIKARYSGNPTLYLIRLK
ncbi:MAG: glycosyltransferase family 39 protein, partial [bacterium]|nr:glycosyltransferase family 39 protein [bacterium]